MEADTIEIARVAIRPERDICERYTTRANIARPAAVTGSRTLRAEERELKSIARHRRLVLGVYIILILGLTLAPLPNAEELAEAIPFLEWLEDFADKIVHALLFSGLGLLLFWNFGWTDQRAVVLRAIGLALVGAALVEVLQSPLPYRHGDVLDFAAGGAGAVAVVVVVAVLLHRRSREAPPRDA